MADTATEKRFERRRPVSALVRQAAAGLGMQIPNTAADILARPAAAVGDAYASPMIQMMQHPPVPSDAARAPTANPVSGQLRQPAVVSGGLPQAGSPPSALVQQAAAGLGAQVPFNPYTAHGSMGTSQGQFGSELDRQRRINAVLGAGQAPAGPPQPSPQQVAEAQSGLYSTDRHRMIQSRAILSNAGQQGLPAIAGAMVPQADGTLARAGTKPDYAAIDARSRRLSAANNLARFDPNTEEGRINARVMAKRGGPMLGYLAQQGPNGEPHVDLQNLSPERFQTGMLGALARQHEQAQSRGGMNVADVAKLKMAYIANRAGAGVSPEAAAAEFDRGMNNIYPPAPPPMLGAGGAVAPGGAVVPVRNVVDPESLPDGPEKERARMKKESASGELSGRVKTDLGDIYQDTKRRAKFDLHAPLLFTRNTPENYKRFHDNAVAGGHSEEAIKNYWTRLFSAEPSSTTH